MRVYVSSTFEDLVEHRAAAIRVLRQLGHDVVAMEDYSATTAPPLEKVLNDVASCDAYVGIFGWRYGYRPRKTASKPPVAGTDPGSTSITEYEYRKAVAEGLEILVFLSDETAPWPANLIDGVSRPKDAAAVAALRTELQEQRLLAYFTSPDSLSARVSAAIATLGVRVEVERRLVAPMRLEESLPSLANLPLFDSHVLSLQEFFSRSALSASTTVDLNSTWWSTRLYLLAGLGTTLGRLARIVFVQGREFVGVASSDTVRRAMLGVHDPRDRRRASPLREFDALLPNTRDLTDVRAELDRLVNEWARRIGATDDRIEHYDVARPDLPRWLGDGFLTSAVTVTDVKALTALDLLRVLDYPNIYVPVLELKPRRRGTPIHLVDKGALTERLARNAVQEMLDRLGLGV